MPKSFKLIEQFLNLVEEPFSNLKYRDRTVLILCEDNDGKFLLGGKGTLYPKGIVRMVGGGVDKDEKLAIAAKRELEEELNIKIEPTDLVPLVAVRGMATHNGKFYTMTTYVYAYKIVDPNFKAGDDVEEIVLLDQKGYDDLVDAFYSLTDDNIHNDPKERFSWGDYGRYYGLVHKAAMKELLSRRS